MELLQLIAQFLEGITSWLPRPYLVNVTERVVRFRTGKAPRLVSPGFRWYTPLFSTIERYSLLKDAVEFQPVVLPTRDGKPVAVGFVIVWHIGPDDVVKAATTTDDLVAMIGEIGESLLPGLVLGYTFEELLERVRGGRNLRTVNDALAAEAQDLLEPYGVTVYSARVNFLAPARVFRLLQGA